jgi:hypothetical protein
MKIVNTLVAWFWGGHGPRVLYLRLRLWWAIRQRDRLLKERDELQRERDRLVAERDWLLQRYPEMRRYCHTVEEGSKQ